MITAVNSKTNIHDWQAYNYYINLAAWHSGHYDNNKDDNNDNIALHKADDKDMNKIALLDNGCGDSALI